MTSTDPLARLRMVADTDEHPDADFARELRQRLLDGLTDATPVAPAAEPVSLDPRRAPRRRRGMVGAALVAAVALVVAMAVLRSSSDESTVATVPPTPASEPSETADPEVDPASTRRVERAEMFLDALYGGDRIALEAAAPAADLGYATYALGWLPVLNAEVLARTCEPGGTGVICFVTVRDDLTQALDIGFDATDEFRFVFVDDQISLIATNTDLPFVVQELYTWVLINDPDAYERRCAGFFAGGPTPDECARLMLAAVDDFKLTDTYAEFLGNGG